MSKEFDYTKLKHVTSVDQSDRKVPYNLRQSGPTKVEMLISTRVKNHHIGIYQCKQVVGEQLFIIVSITQEVTLNQRMVVQWWNMMLSSIRNNVECCG